MSEPGSNIERLEDIEVTQRVVEDVTSGRELRGPGDANLVETTATALRLRALDAGRATPDERYLARLEQRLEEEAPRSASGAWLHRLTEGLTNRRRFALGSLAALVAGLGLLGRANLRRAYLSAQGWRPVAQVAALPDVGAMRFTLGAIEGFLMKTTAGVIALSAICTHQRCILEWEASTAGFNCPCHGATFDARGQHNADGYGLALPSLPRFEVLLADGVAYVRPGR